MQSRWGERRRYATRPLRSPAGTVARERAIAWAQTTVANDAAVYLDTETTGLDGGAEIVDIAVLAADGAVILDTLVRPARPIPLIVSGIHGIRDADVVSAPSWDAIYPELERLLTGRPIVVYNADFDSRIVCQCCAQHAMGVPALDWHCAMRAYAEYCAEPGRSGGFKWHRLDIAARRFGIKPGGHRALADARVCQAIVRAMAQTDAD